MATRKSTITCSATEAALDVSPLQPELGGTTLSVFSSKLRVREVREKKEENTRGEAEGKAEYGTEKKTLSA